MAGKIDGHENTVLNILRGVNVTAPGAIYLALLTTLPADDGSGYVEVAGNAYARQAVPFSAPSPAGTMKNNADVLFPVATPAGWGLITGAMLIDTPSGAGTIYYWSDMADVTLNVGEQLKFAANAIVVTED